MPISSAAQQLLCACITADMRSPNTCCANGNQLVGDIKKTSYPPSGVPTDLQSVVKK